MLEVKSLLRDSRLNIQEIAILTNFPSQSTLNRFFSSTDGNDSFSISKTYIFNIIMFDFHIISMTLNFCCNRYYRSFVV